MYEKLMDFFSPFLMGEKKIFLKSSFPIVPYTVHLLAASQAKEKRCSRMRKGKCF